MTKGLSLKSIGNRVGSRACIWLPLHILVMYPAKFCLLVSVVRRVRLPPFSARAFTLIREGFLVDNTGLFICLMLPGTCGNPCPGA